MFQSIFGLFHDDSYYYLNQIISIKNYGLGNFLKDFNIAVGLNSSFFIILNYLASNLIDPKIFTIFLNIITSILVIKIYSKKKYYLLTSYLLFSPYIYHLRFQFLKDILFINSFLLLYYLVLKAQKKINLNKKDYIKNIYNNIIKIHLSTYLFILLRPTLSIFFIFSFLTSLISPNNKIKIILSVVYIIAIYLIFKDFFYSRMDYELDLAGREIFVNGYNIVSNDPFIRYFFAIPIIYLIPYPFYPENLNELLYLTHYYFFIFLFFIFVFQIIKLSKKQIIFNIQNSISIFCMIFITAGVTLATTSYTGPLLRYRLITEILTLIIFEKLLKKNLRTIK